ncbi:MAG: GGDEF domain-containing protein [Burkholderiales bacterium]
MNLPTVILILSLHLVATGCLLLMIARRTPEGRGLNWFGFGCIAYGASIWLRLGPGLLEIGFDQALFDTGLVLAGLLFYVGLRRFTGRPTPAGWVIAAGCLVFLVVALAAAAGWGLVGRHVWLHAASGMAQVALAAAAFQALFRAESRMRLPLAVMGGLTLALGALTLLRSVVAAKAGVGPMFTGPLAPVFAIVASLVAALIGPVVLWMFVRLTAKLSRRAARDPLTRLLNRGGLDQALRQHFGTRDALPVSVLQIDVDHFKRINDSHGHEAGDAVLRTVASALTRSVRAGDFAARTGGEEFLIGCVETQPGIAEALADRLRQVGGRAAGRGQRAGDRLHHQRWRFGAGSPPRTVGRRRASGRPSALRRQAGGARSGDGVGPRASVIKSRHCKRIEPDGYCCLAGTGVTVSRSTPPPVTLPSTDVLPVPRTRASHSGWSRGGCALQRSSAFFCCSPAVGSVSPPRRASSCAAPFSRRQAARSCFSPSQATAAGGVVGSAAMAMAVAPIPATASISDRARR